MKKVAVLVTFLLIVLQAADAQKVGLVVEELKVLRISESLKP